MKIGLFLQDGTSLNDKVFSKVMTTVKNSDIDLLVFPEFSKIPQSFFGEDGVPLSDLALAVNKKCDKPVLINCKNNDGEIVSLYSNYKAKDPETDEAYFKKHTYTGCSAFESDELQDTEVFNYCPILLNGLNIGVTICNDVTDPLLAGLWCEYDGVDIVINQTGGGVQSFKWKPYNRVRAIESNCFSFCTMNADEKGASGKSFVMGFNPNGKELRPSYTLVNSTQDLDTPGTIYVYDTEADPDGKEVLFNSSKGGKTSDDADFSLPKGKIDSMLKKAKVINPETGLYHLKDGDRNIIFCELKNDEILYPMNVPLAFYDEEIKDLENKYFVIVSKFDHLSKEDFETKYCEVLGVRSIENRAAVVLESDNYNMCITTDNYKHIRYVADEDGMYNIQLKFIKGPDAIWPSNGHKLEWRDKYEWLLNHYETLFEE